jgi:CTP-dependent riboflavin kinase
MNDNTDRKQVFQGTARTGIGGAVAEMSKPGSLEEFRRFFGLPITPGTLNIKLSEPFDLSLLKYVKFADIGWEFDPATQGIQYEGEIGMHYGPVIVAEQYPAFLIFFTWITRKDSDGELVSPHHLRSTLNLRDGDRLEFTLADDY